MFQELAGSSFIIGSTHKKWLLFFSDKKTHMEDSLSYNGDPLNKDFYK